MRLNIKSLPLVVMGLLSFLLTGCKEDGPTIIYQLTLSEHSVVFDMGGASKQIDVLPYPENEPWEIVCEQSQDWFDFEKSEYSLKVTAQPNYSLDTRSASLKLVSPDSRFEPYEVSIRQEAAEPVKFSTTAADHTFDSEGGEYTFTVTSNYDWSVQSDSDWATVIIDEMSGRVTVSVEPNEGDTANTAILTISTAADGLEEVKQVLFTQGTMADNPYFKLIGKWVITAAKWYYSPNGSLNSLDYDPSQTEYYLIFDIEEGEYGKTLIMKNFLYPNTCMEVRYEDGCIIIPFGWTVHSYSMFLYITLVSDRQFSYASLEVKGTPDESYNTIALDIPSVEGFNYVGFGLWTYDEDGNKIAVGSSMRPTMFPMSPIVFTKSLSE